MARVKDLLTEKIDDLCALSGYPFEFLMEMWYTYVDECIEDDEPIDWSYFRQVTLEQDW